MKVLLKKYQTYFKNFKKVVDKDISSVIEYYPLPHKKPLHKKLRNVANKRFQGREP